MTRDILEKVGRHRNTPDRCGDDPWRVMKRLYLELKQADIIGNSGGRKYSKPEEGGGGRSILIFTRAIPP